MKLSECKNLILVCSLLLVVKLNAMADEVQFNRDIRPILANHCFACHGPDAAQRQAELRLDLESAAKADRDPKVIVAHKSKSSELVKRISTADHDLVMPPVEFDKPLSAKQEKSLNGSTKGPCGTIIGLSFLRSSRPCPPRNKSGSTMLWINLSSLASAS